MLERHLQPACQGGRRSAEKQTVVWHYLCNTFTTHGTTSLTECAEHIPVEVPNGRARVTYLINSLKTKDPKVFAALAAVRQDDADKRINFENAFKYLAPTCPVPAKVNKEERSLLMQMCLALKGNTLVA